jgi:chemotaxis response regulator CheB
MGSDGAMGLLELRNAGAVTVAQDAATSVVDGMPRAARDLNAAVHVIALPKLAPLLLNQAEALVQAVNKERAN